MFYAVIDSTRMRCQWAPYYFHLYYRLGDIKLSFIIKSLTYNYTHTKLNLYLKEFKFLSMINDYLGNCLKKRQFSKELLLLFKLSFRVN